MGSIRLSKVLKELNISLERAVEFLDHQGHEIENNRNTKIDDAQYDILLTEFEQDRTRKEKSEQVSQLVREEKEVLRAEKEAVRGHVVPPQEKPAASTPASASAAPVAKEEKKTVVEPPKAEEKKAAPPKEEEKLKEVAKKETAPAKPKAETKTEAEKPAPI